MSCSLKVVHLQLKFQKLAQLHHGAHNCLNYHNGLVTIIVKIATTATTVTKTMAVLWSLELALVFFMNFCLQIWLGWCIAGHIADCIKGTTAGYTAKTNFNLSTDQLSEEFRWDLVIVDAKWLHEGCALAENLNSIFCYKKAA